MTVRRKLITETGTEVAEGETYREQCNVSNVSNLPTYLPTHLPNSMQQSRYSESITQLINSPPFMEPGDSLPHSQEPATGSYPEPEASSPHLSTILP
jgi:hypothetical protein